MEKLNQMNSDDLCAWIQDNGLPVEVVESFRDNEMDGDSLVTLMGSKPGPDSLKDLVQKVGIRMKLYKAIQALYSEESRSETREGSVSREASVSTLSQEASIPSPTPSTATTASASSDKRSSRFIGKRRHKSTQQHKELPDPFPIPDFRTQTEANLANELLTQSDRKYIVQTLATLLMTYIPRPSIQNCGQVAKAFLEKHRFISCEDDDDTLNSWRLFIYTRTQNVNRPDALTGVPKQKKAKIQGSSKHLYPVIPDGADDEVSHKRNLLKLKEECLKSKLTQDVIKTLLIRTYPVRRAEMLDSDSSVSSVVKDLPVLKRCFYMTLEFGLIMQRPSIREEFDEELILWSKAIVSYCKTTQTKAAAIQSVIDDESECDDDSFVLKAFRCLCLLLTTVKTKRPDGDIPYVMKIVPNGTPPSAIPDKNNNQPHIVAIERDEYFQYMIAVEQSLMLECTEIATAIFMMLACHYVFNLSYHTKATDLFVFLQEKVARIQSHKNRKEKSTVSVIHVNGISRIYQTLKDENCTDADD